MSKKQDFEELRIKRGMLLSKVVSTLYKIHNRPVTSSEIVLHAIRSNEQLRDWLNECPRPQVAVSGAMRSVKHLVTKQVEYRPEQQAWITCWRPPSRDKE